MKSRIAFIVFLFLVMLNLMSCTDRKAVPAPPDEPSMKHTDEYDYILSLNTLNGFISDFVALTGGAPWEPIDEEATLAELGYKKPEIDGQCDGENIVLTASYPVLEDKPEYEKILAALPDGKMGFPGRVPPEKLVAYVKLPGVESLMDCTHDIFELLIDKGESPTGKYNPITAFMGYLMMAQIDYKEDLFSWMGSEMGFLMYKAVLGKKDEYVNTAFAMSIKDKTKAADKISKLMKLVQGAVGDDKSKEILTREAYKTFLMDTFEVPADSIPLMGLAKDVITTEKSLKMGILYTDEYLFVSDVYGLKQLADFYDPGGAQVDAANAAAYIDLDKIILLSAIYQQSYYEELRKSLTDQPEKSKKFEDYFARFQNLLKEDNFGKVKWIYKFNEKDLYVRLELTKSAIDLMNFISEWFKETMTADSKLYETKSDEKQ